MIDIIKKTLLAGRRRSITKESRGRAREFVKAGQGEPHEARAMAKKSPRTDGEFESVSGELGETQGVLRPASSETRARVTALEARVAALEGAEPKAKTPGAPNA